MISSYKSGKVTVLLTLTTMVLDTTSSSTSAVKLNQKRKQSFALTSLVVPKGIKPMNQYRDRRDRFQRNLRDPNFREFRRIQYKASFFKQGMEVKAQRDFNLGFADEDGSKQIKKGETVGIVYEVDGPKDKNDRFQFVDVQLTMNNYYSKSNAGLRRHEWINIENLDFNRDSVIKKQIQMNIRKGRKVEFLANVLTNPNDQSKIRKIPQGSIGFVYELEEEFLGRGNQGFQVSLRLPHPQVDENEVEAIAMPECLHWIHAYDRHNVKMVEESTESESSVASVTQKNYWWGNKETQSYYQSLKKIKLSDNVITLNSPLKQEYRGEESKNKEYKVLAIVKDVLGRKDQKNQYGQVEKGWSCKNKHNRYSLQIELSECKENERGILVPETCIIPYYQLHNVQQVSVEAREDPRKSVPLVEVETLEGFYPDGSNKIDGRLWNEHEEKMSRRKDVARWVFITDKYGKPVLVNKEGETEETELPSTPDQGEEREQGLETYGETQEQDLPPTPEVFTLGLKQFVEGKDMGATLESPKQEQQSTQPSTMLEEIREIMFY